MTMRRHEAGVSGARLAREDGVALIIALMAMLLMSALGLALTLTTNTETRISGNYRSGVEAMYAADAAIERVMQDVLTVPDWNDMLWDGQNNCCAGAVTSSFTDGPPFGVRQTAAGPIDLTQATNMVRCGKVTTCSDLDMNNYTEYPWGPNNPRWQLYAYGPMEEMIPTNTINSQMYVIVWIADDPAENDGNPLVDGSTADNPGRGVLAMLAHAYGPNGVRRVIEVTIAKTDTTEIERGYTGQRGQDEQNRRARKAAVQTPGKTLSQQSFNVGQ